MWSTANKHLNLVVTELAWLLGSWAFSFIIVGALVGYRALWRGPLDIQMHNTYFVLNTSSATAPLFLLFAWLTSGVRAAAGHFRSSVTNTVFGIFSVLWLLGIAAVLLLWR